MKDSFNKWRKFKQNKLREKEKDFNVNENYNIETKNDPANKP